MDIVEIIFFDFLQLTFELLVSSLRKLRWSTILACCLIGSLVVFLGFVLTLVLASHMETYLFKRVSIVDILWRVRIFILVVIPVGAVSGVVGAGIFERFTQNIESVKTSQTLIFIGSVVCTLPVVVVIFGLYMFFAVY